MRVLKNNIELDVKTKCTAENKTQAWAAEKAGTSPAYMSRIENSQEQIVNKTCLAMMNAFGYVVRRVDEKQNVAE